MKLITSPAKLMTTQINTEFLRSSTPRFIKEAAFIQQHLKEKSPKYLADLMDISSKLADENWERNQKWKPNPGKKESSPALFAFTGEVYRGLDALTLDPESLKYLQKNYRILSGLYGWLKPSDKIMLYRLEMGRNFEFDQYKDLYSYWRENVTTALNSELRSGEIILNLASAEYIRVLDKEKLKGKLIDFDFYETKGGKPKTIVVYTKHARGMMVRFCAETKAKTLDDVKAFNADGYLFDEEKSTDTKLVFSR